MIKKQTFPEMTIRSIASNEMVYQRGKKIYQESRVGLPYGDYETNTVYLTVQGTKTYTVNFRFYGNGVARKYHCTCPAFESYQGGCKHVVAAMLQLNDINAEGIPAQKQAAKQASGNRLNLLKKRNSEEAFNLLVKDYRKEREMKLMPFSKEKVQVEYVFSISGPERLTRYSLSMKVGLQHLYVVQDTETIIKDLLEGNEIVFGKRFTYSPETHRLSREDRKMLEMLYDIQQVMNNSSPYAPQTEKKEMIIPPQYVKMVLKGLAQVDAGFVSKENPARRYTNSQSMIRPDIVEEIKELPLHFSLEKQSDEDTFLFSVSETDKNATRFYPQTNIISIESVFYFLSPEQYHFLDTLKKAFDLTKNEPIEFSTSQFTTFASEVLPQIRQLIEIYIDPEIEHAIIQPDLEANLYVDWQNRSLVVRPVFRYGEKTIRPLETEEQLSDETVPTEAAWIIRDMEAEYELLDKLNHAAAGWQKSEEYIQTDDLEYVMLFLYETLEELSEDYTIYMTSAAQHLLYEPSLRPSMEMEMNEQSNLLEVSFQTEDLTGEDLRQIVRQLNANKQYYRLSNGKIVNLKERAFQQMNDTLTKMDVSVNDISETMSVPLFKGLSVMDDALVKKGKKFRKLASQLLDPEEVQFELPNTLEASLRPYQKTGFKWLKTLDHYGFGGILADDMGLGKTIQTIAFLLSSLEEGKKPFMIICPSSVLYNWQREINKFAPTIESVLITGSRAEREELVEEAQQNETPVWITSYPLLQRDGDLYEDQTFKTIILDEAQYVKNITAKTTGEVRKLKSRNKFALSGTPIENNLGELYTLFSLIQPGLFSSQKKYKEMDPKEIAEKIKPFVLRRLKRDVLDDLPEKTETTEYIDLSHNQKKLYQTQLSLIRNEMEEIIEDDVFESNRIKVLAGLTRLRQICCDPRLVMPDYTGGSSKLERLLEYLEEARENGKRVVLFSQFTKMLAIIRENLDQKGYDYHYLDGSTKKEDRFNMTTRFNTGEKDLFLISLKAGGTGLNLTGGDTVILYDSWWNPAVEEQAADRVHRFGQKKAVQVIRMITTGTIEERINELQEKKRELIDTVIQVGEKSVTTLSKEEVLSLLEI